MSAWLALLAVPAILGIHWFRRTLPRRPATALWLWGEPRPVPASGRRRDRLPWRESLAWELLAALALAAALADPRWFQAAPARHLVVVLDTRGTLQARGADGQPVIDHLRTDLTATLAGLPRQDRITLVTSGRPPRLIAGPAVPAAEAQAALATWAPDQGWHDLAPALTLAEDLAGPGGGVLLVSDRPPAQGTPGLLLRGEARPSAGLVAARWDGHTVRLRLAAWGAPAQRTIVVTGTQPGPLPAPVVVDLTPGTPRDVALPVAAVPGQVLTIQLQGPDPQPADDTVQLVPPPHRVVRWWCPTDGPLRRALAAAPGAREATHASEADLVTGTDEAPLTAWRVQVVPRDGRPVQGPFVPRRGHPWLDGLDPTGVTWVGGAALAEVPADEILLATPGQVLLRQTDERTLVIYADLDAGTLAAHALWPALIAQVVDERRAALPGVAETTPQAGTLLRVHPPTGATAVSLPDGEPLPVGQDGTVLLPVPSSPGLVPVRLHQQDGVQPWLTLAVQALDPRLGDLTPARRDDRAPVVAAGGTPLGHPPVVTVLAALVAGLALALAWRAHRREDTP